MTKTAHTKQDAPALDGAAWKAVRQVGNGTIDNAAIALDALAVAMRGWGDARRELADAEAEAAKSCEGCAAEASRIADRLRGEADRRRAEADAHTTAVCEKCYEVAKLHPQLTGNLPPLMQYAAGEVGIDKPVTCLHGAAREYVPEVTDANRDALAAFKPVLRNPPDTSALAVSDGLAAAFVRMAEARERYDAACKTLADALAMFRDSSADLTEEAEVEAESVAEAVRIQRERNG